MGEWVGHGASESHPCRPQRLRARGKVSSPHVLRVGSDVCTVVPTRTIHRVRVSETMSQDLAKNYADSLLSTLAEMIEALDSDETGEACEAVQEMPLELVSRVGSPFSILLTFGGPNARIVWDGQYGTDNAELIVSWDETVTRTSEAVRRFAAYFAEIMEEGEF